MPLIAMLTIFFCLTTLLTLGSVRGETRVASPAIQPVYIMSGDKLELVCEQSDGFKVHWLKTDRLSHDYKMIDSNNSTGFLILSEVPGKTIVRLIKEITTIDDEGSYRCAVQSGTDLPYAVQVYILQINEKPGLITNLGNTTTLGCVVSMVERIGMETSWSRNEKEVTFDAAAKPKYVANTTYDENTTEFALTVLNVGEADIGIYQCNIKLKNGNTFSRNVSLYSFPQVKPLGRSKNLMTGLTLELWCKVWGWPLPNVTWEFKERPLNWSDNRISVSSNGTLKIENVGPGDRAEYFCTAWNFVNGSRQQARTSILVRVKGKLAVLWPLLGIALEVIILTCIIYIYERNRARQRAEQERKEAADNQPNSNAQPRHQGRDNVRYRK